MTDQYMNSSLQFGWLVGNSPKTPEQLAIKPKGLGKKYPTKTRYSLPFAMGSTKSKTIPPIVLEDARYLFSQYPPTASLCAEDSDRSNISDSGLSEHILKYQKAAYSIHTYPCIAMFRFLDPTITKLPNYRTVILPKLTPPSSALFLDVGCCFGQVLRRLVVDGADPNNLIGLDLHQEFIEFGYGLFRDGPGSEHPLASVLEAGNIFDERVLSRFEGRIDIIHAASMLHLFSWDNQIKVANRFNKLLSSQSGAMVVGSQLGVANASPRGSIFRHNADTFRKLWMMIGDGGWIVDVTEERLHIDMNKTPVKLAIPGEVLLLLRFIITRL